MSKCLISSNGCENVESQIPHVVVTASNGEMYVFKLLESFPLLSRCEHIWDVNSILFSNIRSHILHFKFYYQYNILFKKNFSNQEEIKIYFCWIITNPQILWQRFLRSFIT
jgi:hypothetical protein